MCSKCEDIERKCYCGPLGSCFVCKGSRVRRQENKHWQSTGAMALRDSTCSNLNDGELDVTHMSDPEEHSHGGMGSLFFFIVILVAVFFLGWFACKQFGV